MKLLSLLKILTVDGGSGKNLGIEHIDSSVLYTIDSDKLELTRDAANYFIKSPIMSTSLHAR